MTLNELHTQLLEDLRIDPTRLLSESSENLNKHATYFRKLQFQRAAYKAMKLELQALEKERYNYYAGLATEVYEYNLDAKAIKFNMDGDHLLIAKQRDLLNIESKLDFYVNACELFKNRNFGIRNTIDMLKFENGV